MTATVMAEQSPNSLKRQALHWDRGRPARNERRRREQARTPPSA